MLDKLSRPDSDTRVRSQRSRRELPRGIDEDAGLRTALGALGPVALRELDDVLSWPEPRQEALLRALIGRPGGQSLAQLIAVATSDTVARLRVRRAIRDLHGVIAS